jgi:phosphohistidine phosphatase
MKTLLTLRHAKSSWDNPEWSDFDRPLNARGLDAARFVGGLIFERSIQPQLIISSPAKRAKQTAVLVREISETAGELIYDERIYEASPLTLFNLVRELDDRFESIMLVGHNPGFEELVRILTTQAVTMPTAALARVNLEIGTWADVETGTNELSFLIRPKDEMFLRS